MIESIDEQPFNTSSGKHQQWIDQQQHQERDKSKQEQSKTAEAAARRQHHSETATSDFELISVNDPRRSMNNLSINCRC